MQNIVSIARPIRFDISYIDFVTCHPFSHLFKSGSTALFMAAEIGDAPTVEVLLAAGADILTHEQVTAKALCFYVNLLSIQRSRVRCILLITFHTPHVLTLPNQGGATVLHAAASAGHIGLMSLIISRGLSATDADNVSFSNNSEIWIALRSSEQAHIFLLVIGVYFEFS